MAAMLDWSPGQGETKLGRFVCDSLPTASNMPSTRQRNTVLAAAATASAGALTFVAPPSTPSAARIEPGVVAGHAAAQPQTSSSSMGAATMGAAMLAAGCAARVTPKGKGQRKAVKVAAVSTDTEVETDCINSIRFLAVDAVNKANSGHPGAPMGQAPIGYLLFAEEMAYNPKDPSWCNRDRFVLSSGHGCMLQYSLLHLAGYDSVAMDDLKQFRQWGSKTPGHPENFETDGIEVTTGPLGMGISNAVGLAAAEAHLAAAYNKPDFTLIDHYTYTIAGDGCMQEGISHEACAYAGHLGLGKLIAFYDDNGITIDGHTDLSFTEDVGKRFEAYGWQVLVVDNGDQDVGAIRKAIAEAKACTDKPTLIKVKTTIGFGSPNKADSHDAHGAPLGADEAEATRKQLGWNYGEFEVPEHVYAAFKKQADAGTAKQAEWDKLFAAYKEKEPELAAQFERAVLNRKLPDNWDECLPKLTEEDNGKATRLHSQDCLNAIAPVLPEFMGGSADLAPSNMTLMQAALLLRHHSVCPSLRETVLLLMGKGDKWAYDGNSWSQFPAYDAQPPQVQSGGRKGRGSLDKETVDTETDMVNTVQKALNTTRKAEGRLSRLLKDRERAELQWREHAVAAREAFYRERDRHMRALKTFDASIQEAQQAQSEARQALRDQNRLEMQTTWKRTMRMASGSAC
eukprot:s5433_g2.t1